MRRAGAAALAAALLSAVSAPAAAAGGTVSVLYAGSLVNVMERQIGPAFAQATGDGYRGYAGGSTALANEIRGKLLRGDVFISAAPSVNTPLMGAGNGGWVTWYGEFGSAPLVIGYSPHSRFAAAFRTKPWWRVLTSPGLRLGRTDPVLDPKGRLTVEFVQREARTHALPGLLARAQIFPEETLLGRLQAGQLDAGFFYSIEAKAAGIPVVSPPLGRRYGARYTVTILNRGPNPAGALAFVRFLLGPRGSAILERNGLLRLRDGEIGGARSAVPASLRPLFGTASG